MNNVTSKTDVVRDICRIHSSRHEKVTLRASPSKLSRKELEDLYYTMLAENQDLKRTVNSQNEKIKLLSTKVLRISTVHRNNHTKEFSKCCRTDRAIINEQYDNIEDLRESNYKMAEKIRLLNMKLCSAKQFLTTNSKRCNRCALNRVTSSAFLNTKRSDLNKHNSTASSHHTSEKNVSVRSVESNTADEDILEPVKLTKCDDNKCKTVFDEQEQKILRLEQELSQIHRQYKSHLSDLQENVLKLQSENVTIRADRKAVEEKTRQRGDGARLLAVRLAETEALKFNLETQLSIETKKVTELETQIKSMEVTNEVVRIIEEHISNEIKMEGDTMPTARCSDCLKQYIKFRGNNESLPAHGVNGLPLDISNFSQDIPAKCRSTPNKCHDDSGYMDSNKTSEECSYKSFQTYNEELKKRVLHLEAELDLHKIIGVGEGSTVLNKMTEDLKPEKVKGSKLTIRKVKKNHVPDTPILSRKIVSNSQTNEKSDLPIVIPRVNSVSEHSVELESIEEDVINNRTEEFVKLNEEDSTNNKDVLFKEVDKKTQELKPYHGKALPVRETSDVNTQLIENTSLKCRISEKTTPENFKAQNHPDENLNPNPHVIRKNEKDTGEKKKHGTEPRGSLHVEEAHRLMITEVSKNHKNHDEAEPRTKIKKDVIGSFGDHKKDTPDKKELTSRRVGQNTYSIKSKKDIDSRAVASDNTDFDVSSISNYSSGKCKSSPSEPLSLGEDRETFSDTSGPVSSSELGYLSEGEIPPQKGVLLSEGEKIIEEEEGRRNTFNTRATNKENRAETIKAAMHDVSEQIARCKYLLQMKPNHAVMK